MGAGGSIPRTEYQIERSRDIDGGDLEVMEIDEIRSEVIRIRGLLHKYADQDAALDLSDIDNEVNDRLFKDCELDKNKITKELCVNNILHFRKMLRKPSLLALREVKEKRRRLSLQGQRLAKMALQGISTTTNSDDSDSDDGLEDMPRK
jgi:hypothetical protein